MINNQLDLTPLGLTNSESKAYIALSELGPSTVGPIVKKTGIAYANVYDVLRRLREKGLVTFIIKGKTKHFQAAPPSELGTTLDQREAELTTQRDFVKKITPTLTALQKSYEPETAEVFIGWEGLRTAYRKMLSTSNEEYIATYIPDEKYQEAADKFYTEFIQKYKGRKFRVVANESFRESTYVQVAEHPTRYTNIPIFAQAEVIGSQLLLVSWQNPIMATLITAKPLAENFRQYFENMWKIAKE